MRFLLVLSSLWLVLNLSAAERPVDYIADDDVRELCSTKLIAFGLPTEKGYVGSEERLARILKREDYVRPLLEVYNRGTPEAKVYALVAFHYLSPTLFEQCRKDLVGKYNPVVRGYDGRLQSVCEGTLLEYIIRIHKGEYDSLCAVYVKYGKPPVH